MARESCNLDKDEAEVLKPNSTAPIQACPEKPNFPGFLLRKPNPVPDSNPEKPTSGQKRKADEIPEQIRSANRCLSCRRKVGLIGFRCRCGELFCSRHRHSDAHGCSFDYKAVGREEIAKANPVVRPPKIIRI